MTSAVETGAVIKSGFAVGRVVWSPQEESLLRSVYKSGGYRAALAALPHRSRNAIFKRASALGVLTHRPWKAEDDARLRCMWRNGDLQLRSIARVLDRTPHAVHRRARHLKLPPLLPPGFEHLTHSARRTGFAVESLRRILKWAEVKVHLCFAIPGKKHTRYRYVWPGDVDDAITHWHETEPLLRAARRVGVSAETLRRALVAIGVKEPKRRFRHHWRVHNDDVARAMAARQCW